MNVFALGKLVEGTILEIRPYGAIISFENERKGLLHITQVSDSYVSNLETYLQLGAQIKVEIIEINEENGFLKLSLKTVLPHDRIRFNRPKKRNPVDPELIDFSPLAAKLPTWLEQAVKELDND